MDSKITNIITILQEAASSISQEYFKLPEAQNQGGVYRERVYCYELYHQIRHHEDYDSVFSNISISGEIDKKGHQIIDNDKVPDFLIHELGEMNNLIIIEVKAIHDRNKNSPVIDSDIEKLENFVCELENGYDYGFLYIFGNSDDTTNYANRDVFKEDNFVLIRHKSSGKKPVIVNH